MGARKPFSIKEDLFLTENYSKMSWSDLGKFSGRNVGSLRKRAVLLGLNGDRGHILDQYRTKYCMNKSYFLDPDIENSYWAGFIAADGCLRVDGGRHRLRLTLQRLDHWHLERFAYDVGYTGPVIPRTGNGFRGVGRSLVSDLNITGVPEWHRGLATYFNITPNKTLTIGPPNIQDKKLCCSYVKGIIDGDGSIFTEGKHLVFSISGTYELLSFIKKLMDQMFKFNDSKGSSASVIRSSYGNYSTYKIKGKRAAEILGYLDGLVTACLPRKWSKIKEEIR